MLLESVEVLLFLETFWSTKHWINDSLSDWLFFFSLSLVISSPLTSALWEEPPRVPCGGSPLVLHLYALCRIALIGMLYLTCTYGLSPTNFLRIYKSKQSVQFSSPAFFFFSTHTLDISIGKLMKPSRSTHTILNSSSFPPNLLSLPNSTNWLNDRQDLPMLLSKSVTHFFSLLYIV